MVNIQIMIVGQEITSITNNQGTTNLKKINKENVKRHYTSISTLLSSKHPLCPYLIPSFLLQELARVIEFYNQRILMLNEEQLADEQLNRLQDIVNDKIDLIRKVLQEQDRSIVQEIVMKKSHSTDPIYPKYDKKNCYYQQFWKVYLLNEIMISKIKEYSDGNKILVKEVQELEDAEKEWSTIWTQKSKKKIRRTSDMIDKIFQCPFDRCSRTYGSDVSLNLHMKLKHNSGTKTERENLAKEICLAQEKGSKIKITLNFPPGYLQEFRQNFRKENAM